MEQRTSPPTVGLLDPAVEDGVELDPSVQAWGDPRRDGAVEVAEPPARQTPLEQPDPDGQRIGRVLRLPEQDHRCARLEDGGARWGDGGEGVPPDRGVEVRE
jgi:hypothetical protein